jgi:hypothetical protein
MLSLTSFMNACLRLYDYVIYLCYMIRLCYMITKD